jgi:uncharacterized protein YgiM (DUF1202 family)
VFGLIVVGSIISIFSDEESPTSTSSQKLNTSQTQQTEQPSIIQEADMPVADSKVAPGGSEDAQPEELLASVKSSLEVEKSADTLSAAPIGIVYSSAKLRMREGPGTSFPTITTLKIGARLEVFAADGEWLRVTDSLKSGWVHRDFVSDSPASIEKPPIKQEAVPTRRLVKKAPSSRSGQAIRDAYIGRCDCPYDLMRNGRLCGGRSAYSRPGGRNPQCYF